MTCYIAGIFGEFRGGKDIMYNLNNKNAGRLITILRKHIGLSGEQAQKKFGLHLQTISRAETGKHYPGSEYLLNLILYLIDSGCSPEQLYGFFKQIFFTDKGKKIQVEEVAEICHEAYRIYRIKYNDNYIKTWSKLTEDEKRSSIWGVEFVIENKDKINPEIIHDAWVNKKISEGWTAGDYVDYNEKVHANMIDYEKLDKKAKILYKLFINTVLAVID